MKPETLETIAPALLVTATGGAPQAQQPDPDRANQYFTDLRQDREQIRHHARATYDNLRAHKYPEAAEEASKTIVDGVYTAGDAMKPFKDSVFH